MRRAQLVTPEPAKRPKSSYVRFEADLPNETWQADVTQWRLATGRDVKILCWLDDSPSIPTTDTTAPAPNAADHHAPTDHKKPNDRTLNEGSVVSDVSRHHMARSEGVEPPTF